MVSPRNSVAAASAFAVTALSFLVACAFASAADRAALATARAKPKLAATYGKLPLAFEPNQGQAADEVKFISRSRGATLYLTNAEAVLVLTKASVPDYKQLASFGMPGAQLKSGAFEMPEPKAEGRSVRMKFDGANTHARIEGVEALGGISNYFIGSDPKKWRTKIPNFARVKYTGLYQGIDLIFYGKEQTLEYDFVVAPGADSKAIKLSFDGADKVELTEKGDLVVHSGAEKLTLHAPVAYQEIEGKRAAVKSAFKRVDDSRVAFEVASYDRAKPLVIDPTLVWATYVAGDFLDIPYAIAVGPFDNPYITGFTCSGDFPNTLILGPRLGCDVFITKRDSIDTNRIYSTIIGGSAFENSLGIAVDGEGAAYVAGQTFSNDFPMAGARQGQFDAFVAKLNADGTLAWSRLVGGSQPTANILGLGWTHAFAIAIPQGCAPNCEPYIAGTTTVTDLQPVNAFQPEIETLLSAYLTKLSADGAQTTYQTYFNGEGQFWGRNPTTGLIEVHGDKPENGDGDATWANGIAVDPSGKAYLTGGTHVSTVPTTLGDAFKGTMDAWVAKFDPAQSGAASRVWSRYVGGTGYDAANSIALLPGCASDCDSYITGQTWSHDFPTTAGAYQTSFGGFQDQFVTKLDASGGVAYSTYVGRAAGDFARAISVDSVGAAYISGYSTFVLPGISYPEIDPLQGPQAPNGILLKSTDGGSSFAATGFAPSNGSILLNNLVIDPVDPNVIYAPTPRSGLLKSTDAGATFAATGIIAGEVPRIAVDPNDTQTVYAGTGAGVRKSIDGGATFVPPTLGEPVCALAIDPRTNPSTLYAGTCRVGAGGLGGTGGVFKSIDGGVTFVALPGLPDLATVFAVAIDPNDDTVYAGTSSGLFKDTGAGFQRTGLRFDPIFALKVDPTATPSTVYGTTFFGIGRSSQGFPFAELIDSGRAPYFSLALDLSTTPATLYAGNRDGELLKSTDRGNTFTIQNLAGFRTTTLIALAAPASASGTVYAGLHEEHDAVVAKLSPDGSQLLFSSFLGGSRGDFGQAIALGSGGHPYVTGGTSSADFGSAACGGVNCVSGVLLGQDNAFVAKLPNTLGSGEVTTQTGSNTTVTFENVTTGGETTQTNTTVGPALPVNFAFAEPGNQYFDIQTTATVSGAITVCVDYDPAKFVDPNQLRLLHFQNNAWVNVTVSNDTTNGLICGQVASLSLFAFVTRIPLPVAISIKPPAAPPVPINISSAGVIPVAILSGDGFDATTVNPGTINLSGANVRLKGKGSYQCSSSDVNGDALADLLCQVPTDQFQLIPGSDVAVLTAVTNSSEAVQGQQQVVIVPE
jgi:hypothetical protein